MQGQARRFQGYIPRGPSYCCSKGLRLLILPFMYAVIQWLLRIQRLCVLNQSFAPFFFYVFSRLFWTTLRSTLVKLVTLQLARCQVQARSVQSSAGLRLSMLEFPVILCLRLYHHMKTGLLYYGHWFHLLDFTFLSMQKTFLLELSTGNVPLDYRQWLMLPRPLKLGSTTQVINQLLVLDNMVMLTLLHGCFI